MIKYFHFLYKKAKEYDRKATNPFYKKEPNKPITEQTYIWVDDDINDKKVQFE